MEDRVVQWLMGDSDLAVKFRTQTEMLKLKHDCFEVKTAREKFLLSDNESQCYPSLMRIRSVRLLKVLHRQCLDS